jgi:hypothetical protein
MLLEHPQFTITFNYIGNKNLKKSNDKLLKKLSM